MLSKYKCLWKIIYMIYQHQQHNITSRHQTGLEWIWIWYACDIPFSLCLSSNWTLGWLQLTAVTDYGLIWCDCEVMHFFGYLDIWTMNERWKCSWILYFYGFEWHLSIYVAIREIQCGILRNNILSWFHSTPSHSFHAEFHFHVRCNIQK